MEVPSSRDSTNALTTSAVAVAWMKHTVHAG